MKINTQRINKIKNQKVFFILKIIVIITIIFNINYLTNFAFNSSKFNLLNNNDESCKLIKIYFENDSIRNCFTKDDISNIKKILKKQKYLKASKFIIRKQIVTLNNNYIGLFFVETENLSIKKIRAYVPLLKFKDKLVMNFDYENGKPIGLDTISINNDINCFYDVSKELFSEKDLQTIISYYKYGIQYAPKYNIYFK